MNSTVRAPGPLEVTLPSDRAIRLTRNFNGPRRLVFDALTKPELIRRWLSGPPGWTVATCDVDLRPGGAYRYLWHGPGNVEMGLSGVFVEIAAPERVVTAEKFDQPWYDGDCIGTTTLVETAGGTAMTMDLLYDTKAIRDGVLQSPMKDGMEMSFKHLDELLASPPTT